MSWRVAKSLLHLRDQVNAKAPLRDKSSDGTIGDASHQTRDSDHNPWVQDQGLGVVTALDISNDPAHKVVSRDIAETLRQSRDSRLKYVISNGQIFSSEVHPWEWRSYSGPNLHYHHVHISVLPSKSLYDGERDWALPQALGGQPSVPTDLVSSVSLGDMAHQGEQGPRVLLIQSALKKAGALLLALDSDFGPGTEAAVKRFQEAKKLQVDGIVGPATASELQKYLGASPPPPIPPEAPDVAWSEGKGSWYSQYEGRYNWVDSGDKPGSAALHVPDSAQGISFYDWATLGKWFEVEFPNGKRSIEQQTDIGPSPWTGKKIDVSAAAADRAGYSPSNFPTGGIIKWRRVDTPKGLEGLTPQAAAVAFRDSRTRVA